MNCYCDSLCYLRGDCCPDIYIGCEGKFSGQVLLFLLTRFMFSKITKQPLSLYTISILILWVYFQATCASAGFDSGCCSLEDCSLKNSSSPLRTRRRRSPLICSCHQNCYSLPGRSGVGNRCCKDIKKIHCYRMIIFRFF